jgi:ABC-type transporter Mla MlaB component
MLRILVFDEPFSVKLRLEGELTGQTAPQLTQRWAEVRGRLRDRRAILDLGDVVKVDEAGRDILGWLTEAGVRVSYAHPSLNSLVEDLDCLPSRASRRGITKRLLVAGRKNNDGAPSIVRQLYYFVCSILPPRFRPCGCRSN